MRLRRLPVRPLGRDRDRLRPVRAARISYVGELGWELYVPSEFAPGVLEALLDHPEPPRLCGFHTLHAMRTESGFRH